MVGWGFTRDHHNCLSAAGYTWCPSAGNCVRGWRDSCPGGTEICQQLCDIEPDFNDELEACGGDHATWQQHASGLDGILGGAAEQYRTCSSYSPENTEGCSENVDSE